MIVEVGGLFGMLRGLVRGDGVVSSRLELNVNKAYYLFMEKNFIIKFIILRSYCVLIKIFELYKIYNFYWKLGNL